MKKPIAPSKPNNDFYVSLSLHERNKAAKGHREEMKQFRENTRQNNARFQGISTPMISLLFANVSTTIFAYFRGGDLECVDQDHLRVLQPGNRAS